MALAWRDDEPIAPALAQGRPLSISEGTTRGFWGNFAAAWLQGSGLNLQAEDALERLRQFNGAAAPPPVAGYSPFRDLDGLRGYEEDLHLFMDSRSPEETAFIRRRIDQLRQRARDLDDAGFWSQFLAGNLTPEALVSLPLGIGRLAGATRGARALEAGGRLAAISAGAAAVEGFGRDQQLPAAAQGNLALEIAFSALFGAALGGMAGAFHPQDLARAARRHAERHDAHDGFRTPGVEERPPAAPEGEFSPAGEGFIRREAMPAWDRAATANDNSDWLTPAILARLTELAGDRAAFWREIGDRGRWPTLALLDLRDRGDGFGDLIERELRARGLSSDGARRLIRVDEDAPAGRANDNEPAGFRAEAGGEGGAAVAELRGRDLAPGIARAGEGPANAPEAPGWRVRDQWSGEWVVVRSIANDLDPPEPGRMPAREAGAATEPPGLPLSAEDEATLDALEQAWRERPGGAAADASSPAGAGAPSSPPADAPAPATGGPTIPVPPPANAPGPIPPHLMQGNRLAPAFGLEKGRWTPFYVLANNRFAGTLGESLARLAHRIAMTPGLRIRGNAEGTTASATASVEAVARQHAARYLAAEQAQRTQYYLYRGWDPDTAGDVRSRAVELKENVLGGRPQGVMSFAEFDQAVGLAVATGQGDPQAVAAARAWRDLFYEPMEKEGAEAGVLLSAKHRDAAGAALDRELRGIEARQAEVNAELSRLRAAEARRFKAETGGWPAPDEVDARLASDPIGKAWLDEEFALRGEATINAQRREALAAATPHPEPYVPHVWRRGFVREERDRLVDIVARHWDGQAGHTWASAGIRAEVAVSHLLSENPAEGLERVLLRHFRDGGLAPEMAAERAAALAKPVHEAMRRRSPSRIAREVASVLGRRLGAMDKDGIPELVAQALRQAGVPGQAVAKAAHSALPPPPGAALVNRGMATAHPGKAIDRLLAEIVDAAKSRQGDRWADFARPGHAKQRMIDVPTAEIADFLDLSQRTGALDYARRIGAAVETSREFGDPSMLNELGRNRIEMLRQVRDGVTTLDEMRAQDQAAKDLRDKVLGAYAVPEDPDALSVRTVRVLQQNAIATQMGWSLLSQITDYGRVAMAIGFQRLVKSILEANPLFGDQFAAYRKAAREVRLAGAAELALLGRMQAVYDIQHVGGDRALIERWSQGAAETMMFVNGMAPATQLAQSMAGINIVSEMLELAGRAAKGSLSAAERTRMLAYGLDEAMARRIDAEWRAAGAETFGLQRMANTEAWQDQALVRRFRGMVATAIDSAVMRPNVADRPNFMSAPLAQGLLLYKGFTLAATQRMLMAGLQQRDMHVLGGVLSSVALAWIFAGPADGPFDKNPMTSLDRIVTAVEKSGATGLFADANHALEMLSSNRFGVRPLLGVPAPSFMRNPTWAQHAAAVGGPAVAPMLNVVWALTDPKARGDQQAGAVRRMIWFNNLLWWDWAVRGVTREIGTAIGNPQRPSARPPAVSGFAGGGRSSGE